MPDPLVDALRGQAVMQPTPRSPLMGIVADLLRSGRDFANKAQFNPDLPLVGGQGLGDLTLGKMPEEIDDWSYGNSPVQVNPYAGQTGSFVPEVKRNRKESLGDTILAAQGIPGGNKMLLGAAAGGLAPGPADVASYLAHTPLKPNPKVGTRFERTEATGLAPKKPVKIEDLKGASASIMPWDLSGRGFDITSVSDEVLPKPVRTTGGQDFARDEAHMAQGVAGASNLPIAKRIRDRNETTLRENLEAGGSGRALMLPSTMGDESEFFSSMPANVLLELIGNRNLPKKELDKLSEMVRKAPVQVPKKGLVRPFGDFVGFDDVKGVREQMLKGTGPRASPGELRKAIAKQMSKVGPQKTIGYNREDMMAAIQDPALRGTPKGYVGNTVIEATPGTPFSASTTPDYDTNFAGQYLGSLGVNAPVEVLMPKTYNRLFQEMQGRPGDTRNMVLGAMEKRGEGFSELIDQESIDSFYKWLESQGRR